MYIISASTGLLYLSSEDEEESDGEKYLEDGNNPTQQIGEPVFLMPSLRVERTENPDLPDTVTHLTTEEGANVYLIGTAHLSEESQQDVAKVGHMNSYNRTICVVTTNQMYSYN